MRAASADIQIRPAATASRAVDGLARHIDHSRRAVAADMRQPLRPPAPRPRLAFHCSLAAQGASSPCARKNDRLSSDTVRSMLFSFTPSGTLIAPGEKFRIALMPAAATTLTTACAAPAGTAIDGDPDVLAADDLSQVADVVDRHAGPRTVTDLVTRGVEHRNDLEPLFTEAGIVRERQAEVAGPHDRDADPAVDAEDLPEMPAEFLHVVADAADAELPEVSEVFADLSRVEVKLLGERL